MKDNRMIDKYCTREQVQRLLTLGVKRKYPHLTHLAESRDFYFWELLYEYLPETIQRERAFRSQGVHPIVTWFFRIERSNGIWALAYDDIGIGGDQISTIQFENENPAIAAADLLIYLKENSYV
jgi:hypothetical protein